MKTVILGETGVEVSEICLGAMHLGSNTPDDASEQILDTYTERGGAFLDTANIYNRDAPRGGGGASERFIGRWMKRRRNRTRLFIATKVGMHYEEQSAGLRAEQIETECEKSLRRLGLDTIDLYYAHADDRETPLEESLAAFDRLVQSGKVRFIGASNHLPTRLVEARWTSKANGWASYCCIQQRFSYLQPRPGVGFGMQKATNEDLLDYCEANNFPLIGYAPALKGALASRPDRKLNPKYAGEDNEARLSLLHEVAKETGVTAVQLALAWMRHRSATVIPLIGAGNRAQLEENLEAVEIRLDDNLLARLG